MAVRHRIERKVNTAIAHSHNVMSQSEATLAQSARTLRKLDALLDEVVELFERLETKGLAISLRVAGRDVPLEVVVKLNNPPEVQS